MAVGLVRVSHQTLVDELRWKIMTPRYRSDRNHRKIGNKSGISESRGGGDRLSFQSPSGSC